MSEVPLYEEGAAPSPPSDPRSVAGAKWRLALCMLRAPHALALFTFFRRARSLQ